MRSQRVACSAAVKLTNTEYQRLDAQPDGAHQLQWELRCEFESHHDGPHCALAQQTGDDAWWLRWDNTDLRELAIHEHCPFHAVAGDHDSEPCIRIRGHGGAHSFERTAPP